MALEQVPVTSVLKIYVKSSRHPHGQREPNFIITL